MLYSVRMVNVQSVNDITFEFSNGLNVLVAENNTGKSVLFKIMALLPEIHKTTRDERRQYITFGRTKSDIYFYCSTGFYWLELTLDRVNFYGGDTPQSIEFLGNELPIGLRQGLSLLVCEGGLVANLITEDQSKFLVESDSRVNYSIFKLMTTDENSEKLIDGCEEKIKVLTRDIRIAEATKEYVTKELGNKSKVDVAQQEYILNMTKPLIDLGESLIPICESLSNVKEVTLPNEKLKDLIVIGECIDDLSKSLSTIKPVKVADIPKGLIAFALDLNDIQNKLQSVKHIPSLEVEPNVLNDLLNMGNYINDISKRVSGLKSIKLPNKTSVESLGKILQIRDSVKEVISVMERMEEIEEQIDDLKYELDSLEGEVYDCPVHGTIKFVNGKECVPYNSR